jgi:hypothetical protein
MSGTASPEQLRIRQHDGSTASRIFQVLFWIHQVVLGLPSMGSGFQLVTEGQAQGIISVIGFFLAWIGGTLVWGLAVLIHQRPFYDLPPLFVTIQEDVARLAAMQVHAEGVGAITETLDTRGSQ